MTKEKRLFTYDNRNSRDGDDIALISVLLQYAAGDGAEAVPEISPRPSAGAGRAAGENAPADAGTYSTALVSVPRSCAGAPSAPISDTVDETDTGHSSRNSTTAHSA